MGVSGFDGDMKKKAKYFAKKVEIDGYKFDSQKEGKRYLELRTLMRGGIITDLKVHPRYPLDVLGEKVCDFVPDFEYIDVAAMEKVVEDVKGMRNNCPWSLFRVKAKLFKVIYGIEVKVI